MISALSGITKLKPTFDSLPLPGIQPRIVDDEGNELTGNNVEGNLCIQFPWTSMIRTTYRDHDRCRLIYFSTFKDLYFGEVGSFSHNSFLTVELKEVQGNFSIFSGIWFHELSRYVSIASDLISTHIAFDVFFFVIVYVFSHYY